MNNFLKNFDYINEYNFFKNKYSTLTDNSNNVYALFSINDFSNYKKEIFEGFKKQFPNTFNGLIQYDNSNNNFIFIKNFIFAININNINNLNIDKTKKLKLKIDNNNNLVIDDIKYVLSTKFENNYYVNIYQLTQKNENETIVYNFNKYNKNLNINNFLTINNVNLYLIYEPLNDFNNYIKINI